MMKFRKQLLFVLNSFIILILILGLSRIGRENARAQGLEFTDVPERQPGIVDELNPYSSDAVNPASAIELAQAMDVPSGDLISASIMGSDPAGVGVSNASLGSWFPSGGSSFAILATGKAEDASRPNDSGYHSGYLTGLNNNLGTDLVRLHLELRVPAAVNCLNFDFAFYSEEFPEFVGSNYNDTFTAQLNNSNLTVDSGTFVVNAPGNFAFDSESNVISVNTVFGVSANTGTTYDGGTPILRASTSVNPNSDANIYLSVQDVGDSIFDSAVFLDRFFWSQDSSCTGGASVDTDGDGLLDDWESDGLTVDGEFVDLPAMGADPQHKDVFVEIDWMGNGGAPMHNHAPDPDAIQEIVDAFDNAPVSNPDGQDGVHLHVDFGPNSPLTWGSAATWGTLSEGNGLDHAANISTCDDSGFSWDGFDTIKNINFEDSREAIFHYNVWGHSMCSDRPGTSGISRNGGSTFGDGASDFIVSLGEWEVPGGTEDQQAGTFMHELGHNLGLKHGGPDHDLWKPNYLSVMNYSFQTRGLMINSTEGHFDYSRYDLPNLVEFKLNEAKGIGVPTAIKDEIGTRYFCGQDNMIADWDARTVDWNCDGDATDNGVGRNINEGVWWSNDPTVDTLTTHNDWINLVYSGGAIGAPGAEIPLPNSTEIVELNQDQDDDIAPSSPDAAIFLPLAQGGS